VVVGLSWKLAANGMFNGCKENEKLAAAAARTSYHFLRHNTTLLE
jgi:hypothetical protein